MGPSDVLEIRRCTCMIRLKRKDRGTLQNDTSKPRLNLTHEAYSLLTEESSSMSFSASLTEGRTQGLPLESR